MDDYIGLLHRDGLLRAISTVRALSQRLRMQALLPWLGLGLLVALTGVRCALITSVLFSPVFMVHIAAFHIPTSSEAKGYSC